MTRNDMAKTAIISGSKAQYHNYLIDNGLSPHDHVYVHNIHALRGWMPREIITVGTYFDNPIFDSIDAMYELKMLQARIRDKNNP